MHHIVARPQSDRDLIVRHDSSISAIRRILESSQSSQEQTPASETSDQTPDQTPDQTSDQTPASETPDQTPASETPTDIDETQTPIDPPVDLESQETQDDPTTEVPETPETPPETPSTDSSPPLETDTRQSYITHRDYVAQEIESNKKKRVSLRTRAPRLFHHGYKMFESFCSYAGVVTVSYLYIFTFVIILNFFPSHTALTDGTRIAVAGIVWKVYNDTYEVVFTGSLGWKNTGKDGNSRSHHIQLPGPHYVFVRSATLQGRNIQWSHLEKFIAQVHNVRQ